MQTEFFPRAAVAVADAPGEENGAATTRVI
jgi:hypothetical protein